MVRKRSVRVYVGLAIVAAGAAVAVGLGLAIPIILYLGSGPLLDVKLSAGFERIRSTIERRYDHLSALRHADLKKDTLSIFDSDFAELLNSSQHLR